MGVEQYYISGLEAGRRNPTIVTLWHAAEALGVRAAQLLEEKNRQPRAPSRKRTRS